MYSGANNLIIHGTTRINSLFNYYINNLYCYYLNHLTRVTSLPRHNYYASAAQLQSVVLFNSLCMLSVDGIAFLSGSMRRSLFLCFYYINLIIAILSYKHYDFKENLGVFILFFQHCIHFFHLVFGFID